MFSTSRVSHHMLSDSEMEGMRECGIYNISVQDMVQAEDNKKKTRQRGKRRVRRRLSDPINGHAAKHWPEQRAKELRQNNEKKRNADD